MDLMEVLRKVELFEGLSSDDLEAVARTCRERRCRPGEVITTQGDPGDELFVVADGFVEVVLDDRPGEARPRTMVSLGRGQIFGEMSLVDQGPRSATVRSAAGGAVLQVIDRDSFQQLCEQNSHLGYIVMRNMAADLSFKLRHQQLSARRG
jgi:CRP-like cAMP-binding protein